MPLDIVANFINTLKISNKSKQLLLDYYVTDFLEKITSDGFISSDLFSVDSISLEELYQQLDTSIPVSQQVSYTESLFSWQVSYLDKICAKCLELYSNELDKRLGVYYEDIKSRVDKISS